MCVCVSSGVYVCVSGGCMCVGGARVCMCGGGRYMCVCV